MTKAELIEALAQKKGITKSDCANYVDSIFNILTATLKQGEIVKIAGFGRFDVAHRNGRKCVDPRNGLPVNVPKRTYVRFKASRKLIVNHTE